MIWGSGGSKSRLAKAAGAEPAGQMRDEKVHAVVARSTFPSQNVQNTSAPDHFWKLRCRKSARRCGAKHISKSKCTKHLSSGPLLEVGNVEKVHAVVARSTFRSQNVQSTPFSDHFWKLRCRKSARRCGAKHISKWKCTKHYMFAPLLEVQMSKKCTKLWRETHFEVKMYKTLGVRTTFGGSDVASPLRFTTLHYVTLHHTPLYFITLHYTPQHYNYNYTSRLHSTTLHYIKFHYTTLHYTTLHIHYTTLNFTTLHYTTFHYTTLHNTTTTTAQLHSTTLHYTKLHYTTLHYSTLHSTTLHSTTLHYITLHYLPLHFTITLHYTPLHYNYNYDYTTTLHYTKVHYTTLHYTTLHYIPLHSTTLHYTTLHWMTLHHR